MYTEFLAILPLFPCIRWWNILEFHKISQCKHLQFKQFVYALFTQKSKNPLLVEEQWKAYPCIYSNIVTKGNSGFLSLASEEHLGLSFFSFCGIVNFVSPTSKTQYDSLSFTSVLSTILLERIISILLSKGLTPSSIVRKRSSWHPRVQSGNEVEESCRIWQKCLGQRQIQ